MQGGDAVDRYYQHCVYLGIENKGRGGRADGDGGGIIVCPGRDLQIVVICPVSVLRPDHDNAVHHGWILHCKNK